MKKYERDILLQNINGLPDKQQSPDQTDLDQETDEALLSVAVNSPNPNFIVLDKEMLEYTLDLESETIKKKSEINSVTEVQTAGTSSTAPNESPGKASTESDA